MYEWERTDDTTVGTHLQDEEKGFLLLLHLALLAPLDLLQERLAEVEVGEMRYSCRVQGVGCGECKD